MYEIKLNSHLQLLRCGCIHFNDIYQICMFLLYFEIHLIINIV